MKKYLLYLILPLLGILCSASACDDDCEEAANGLNLKFDGKWCVTHIRGTADNDVSQHVKEYWSLRKEYTYTLYQTSGDVEATFADGVLNAESIAWRSSSGEFEPKMDNVDLVLHQGSYTFSNPDCFVLTEPTGTQYTFERIKTIKQ